MIALRRLLVAAALAALALASQGALARHADGGTAVADAGSRPPKPTERRCEDPHCVYDYPGEEAFDRAQRERAERNGYWP